MTSPLPSSGLRRLRAVLAAKIALTLAAWALPLLLLPASALAALTGLAPEPPLTARLLGLAYLALVVAYAGGLRAAGEGRVPWAVIGVGVLSNGGAAILLAASPAIAGSPLLLASAAASALIAAALAACAWDLCAARRVAAR